MESERGTRRQIAHLMDARVDEASVSCLLLSFPSLLILSHFTSQASKVRLVCAMQRFAQRLLVAASSQSPLPPTARLLATRPIASPYVPILRSGRPHVRALHQTRPRLDQAAGKPSSPQTSQSSKEPNSEQLVCTVQLTSKSLTLNLTSSSLLHSPSKQHQVQLIKHPNSSNLLLIHHSLPWQHSTIHSTTTLDPCANWPREQLQLVSHPRKQ